MKAKVYAQKKKSYTHICAHDTKLLMQIKLGFEKCLVQYAYLAPKHHDTAPTPASTATMPTNTLKITKAMQNQKTGNKQADQPTSEKKSNVVHEEFLYPLKREKNQRLHEVHNSFAITKLFSVKEMQHGAGHHYKILQESVLVLRRYIILVRFFEATSCDFLQNRQGKLQRFF